jgi:regulator of cell morphogenesis and NO signaling
MTITEHTTVAEIAAEVPSSVPVFQRHGIDFCCGGRAPLALVCQEQGVPFTEIVNAIEVSAQGRPNEDRDWNREPLHALIDHIVRTYHDRLRDELPRLESMASKVARVHGMKAPYLARLERIVSELSADLLSHMKKEERVLFPVIRAIEAGPDRPTLPISAPIAVMELEHGHAGSLLSELHTMTHGYVAPAWACGTCRALYQGLSELADEMHVHVHLENNILFPRALDLTHVTT